MQGGVGTARPHVVQGSTVVSKEKSKRQEGPTNNHYLQIIYTDLKKVEEKEKKALNRFFKSG